MKEGHNNETSEIIETLVRGVIMRVTVRMTQGARQIWR